MVPRISTKWMGSWLLVCSWRRLSLDVLYGFRPPARRGYGFPGGRLYVGWLPSCRSSGVGSGDEACSTVSSWAWQWWESLTDVEKSAVKSAAKVSGSKRAADTKESQSSSSKKAKVWANKFPKEFSGVAVWNHAAFGRCSFAIAAWHFSWKTQFTQRWRKTKLERVTPGIGEWRRWGIVVVASFILQALLMFLCHFHLKRAKVETSIANGGLISRNL